MKTVTFIKKFSIAIILLLTILVVANSSIAEDNPNPVSVSTQVTPDTFTIGDIATYEITVQHDPDIKPSPPDIEPPKGLELIEQGEYEPNKTNGQTINKYWYKFRVDDTGKLTIPSIQVNFIAPDQKQPENQIQGTILAPEVELEVQSLLDMPGTQDGIRDIKPLEEYPLPWLSYFWQALAVIAVSGLLYFLWKRWKSRPMSLNIPAPDPELTPEQLAFKELEALKKKEWLQIGRTQEYFFELSEIFRRYLENRYRFPAQEWTTEEITAHFKHLNSLSDNLKLKARNILKHTDRVKFAKEVQTEDEMPSIINFIDEAQPSSHQAESQS